MKFQVERDVLAEAVGWVSRALPARPVIPVLSGLLLQAGDGLTAGGLTLSCFDYEVSARAEVGAEVAEPGTVLVPGRLLAEITRSLPSLPVEFADDPDGVSLTCGSASFTLVTLPVEEYPDLPVLSLTAGTVDGGDLAAAVGQVAPAASRDDTLPLLTGVNLEVQGETMTLAATDRYRLAVRDLAWSPARPDVSGSYLVPARTLGDAARTMAPGVPVTVWLRSDRDRDTELAREYGERRRGRPGPRRFTVVPRRRRHDRVRVRRAPGDHPPDRGGVHQVPLPVPGRIRLPGRHARRPVHRGGPPGLARGRAWQCGPADLRRR